jgi:hypothetical protein
MRLVFVFIYFLVGIANHIILDFAKIKPTE